MAKGTKGQIMIYETQHRKVLLQKWWVLCSFAYLRWRRRDVCNFHMIYIEDNLYNCMDVNYRNGKWDFELSQIKWDKNEWKPWNIRGSWSVWKSEAANYYTGLYSLCKMSEIHEIGGVRYQIYQRIIFGGQLAGINLDSWTLDKLLFTNLIFLASKIEVPTLNIIWSFLQARKFQKWLNLKENNTTICILAGGSQQ